MFVDVHDPAAIVLWLADWSPVILMMNHRGVGERRAIPIRASVAVIGLVIAGAASASPVDPTARDVAAGLKISVTVASASVSPSDPMMVTVILRNVSERPLTVLSHIATHETHLDWYRFRLEYLAPDDKGRCDLIHARHGVRQIGIADSRDKSIPVVRTLAPGDSVTHTVDLQAWAGRKINGATRISSGLYKLSVVYAISSRDTAFSSTPARPWIGSVEAPGVPVTVTGSLSRDRCRASPG